MKGKYLLPIILVLAIAFVGVTAASAESGQENLTIINFVGSPMIFTLDDVQHVVPGTDTVPAGGRLDLTVDAGHHKYSAHTVGVASDANGEFDLAAGQTVVLGARAENGAMIIFPATMPAETPSPAASAPAATTPAAAATVVATTTVTATVVTTPVTTTTVVTGTAAATNTITATPTAPAGTSESKPVETSQPAAAPLQPGLTVTNYTSDVLTFTVNKVTYAIPAAGKQYIELKGGEYAYTASVPGESINAIITLAWDQAMEMSVVHDFASGHIVIYTK